MKPQLKQEEIEKLFTFVQSKNVPYRDVQFEIVDHLATAIEDLQEENPEWSFGLCLDQVYGKFPITGFAQLIQQKEDALNKYWKKKLWPYLLEYFKLPRIILTGTLFFLLQQILNHTPDLHLGFSNYFNHNTILIWIGIVILFITSYSQNKIYERGKENLLYLKSFLTAQQIVSSFLTIGPLYFYLVNPNSTGSITFSGINSYFLASFVVGIIIKLHAFHFVFPKLLHEEAQNKYAHLKMKLA